MMMMMPRSRMARMMLRVGGWLHPIMGRSLMVSLLLRLGGSGFSNLARQYRQFDTSSDIIYWQKICKITLLLWCILAKKKALNNTHVLCSLAKNWISITTSSYFHYLECWPGPKRSIVLTEIYSKFAKLFIQIAGPKNIQHNSITCSFGCTFHQWLSKIICFGCLWELES